MLPFLVFLLYFDLFSKILVLLVFLFGILVFSENIKIKYGYSVLHLVFLQSNRVAVYL